MYLYIYIMFKALATRENVLYHINESRKIKAENIKRRQLEDEKENVLISIMAEAKKKMARKRKLKEIEVLIHLVLYSILYKLIYSIMTFTQFSRGSGRGPWLMAMCGPRLIIQTTDVFYSSLYKLPLTLPF